MTEKFDIAGYCRISVDDELDRDNTSIENQKLIIEEFVRKKFPQSTLAFYEDRDRSGYTFEQREGYQAMRGLLLNHTYDILIVKDFSRFARRNSRGLVELEDLRDAGVRIISIGDSIDYPTYDDWVSIQFRFLVNELPVTDTSKKVKNVITRRQNDGKWICAVPYGYVITNSKTMTFEIDEPAAQIVRTVFELYNKGWGYKRISNHLTDMHIPTPRMIERERKESKGEECKLRVKPEWSIITIEGMLKNDFYVGTLRQGKFKRKKINGSDVKIDPSEHIIFENHHAPIVDYRTFAITQEQLKKRSVTNYRGIKLNDNVYSGFLYCADCGSPMFSMSRKDLKPAYTCGTYHRRGLKGCTSHHVRVDTLDSLLKSYVLRVKNNSGAMIEKLEQMIASESTEVKNNEETTDILEKQLEAAKEELKATKRQKIREIMKKPEQEEFIEETFVEIEEELENRISGLQNQIALTADKRNTIIKVNRVARTALDIFDEILKKDKLDKTDLELIIEKILIYEDHLEIKLKNDIDSLLSMGEAEEAVNFTRDTGDIETRAVQSASKRQDKVFRVNVISGGDPLEIYTDRDGEVILKKFSPIGELSTFAKDFTDSLYRSMGHIACICDKDMIIAASGSPKKELIEKPISSEMEHAIAGRQTIMGSRTGGGKMTGITADSDDNGAFTAQVITPIIADGEAIGAVMLLSKEQGVKMGEVEIKVAETAAGLVAKQMEQ